MSKTILITGTSSGIGRATALFFAKNGWNVVASVRHLQDGSHFASFPNVLVQRLDVRREDSIRSTVTHAIERFGRIDALANNAGYGMSGIFETTPVAQIEDLFAVNLFGVMNATRAVLPHLRERREGVIVNISSGSGVFAPPAASLYAATKFALEGFSESLGYELASQRIRVKLIEIGTVLSSRNFFERSALESSSNHYPADYEPFMSHTRALLAARRSLATDSEDDVARCIFTAATDSSEQLRYYVAMGDVGDLIRARRETSETQYMSLVRMVFSGPPTTSDR